VNRESELLAPLTSVRPTLVAGSTWPSDEMVLFEAWPSVRRDIPDARLIIAPHEPGAARLAAIEDWARSEGLSLARVGSADATADVVLVDRTGVLGDLYSLATAAFVGGGFHGAGLHSVLEPAAFGAPVAFGPRHSNSRDAVLLHRSRGGDSVTTADETIEVLQQWLGDPAAREAAGSTARAFVQRGLGAGERSYDLVMELLFPAPVERATT
jgi:3-deoxy-D-manno-octulosonic-acid transferase